MDVSTAEPVDRATAIALREVSRTYGDGPNAVEALRRVNLRIGVGELVVLLGPSGSGKTTLLNLVGALERPTSGQLEIAGHDIGSLDEKGRTAFRSDSVGFVFQFFNLVPTLTARENIELILELTGRDDAVGKAQRALNAVGLKDRADHTPGELSGGEQQRVAIARAVAKDPAVLLCDEPTGALDVETGRRVLEVLREINRDAGRTVLMVTHNGAIAEMADRVIRLRSGEVVADEVNANPVAPDAVEW